MAFMTSEPGADEDKKKQDLLEELQSVNEFLEKSGKPYFGGDDVNALDMSMAPKIKHIKIGADEVKVCIYCTFYPPTPLAPPPPRPAYSSPS